MSGTSIPAGTSIIYKSQHYRPVAKGALKVYNVGQKVKKPFKKTFWKKKSFVRSRPRGYRGYRRRF